MNVRTKLFVLVAGFGCAALARAQDKVFLRPEPGGPSSIVKAVAFGPYGADGQRLYAAGFDKTVHVWNLSNDGKVEPSKMVYRVPIGAGLQGTINALAASPDGKWLAVGGIGVTSGQADYHQVGMVFPTLGALTKQMLEEQGAIYLFDVNNPRAVKVLRGHAGTVQALAFLPAQNGKPPQLVSTAEERPENAEVYTAHVRLWDVSQAAPSADTTLDFQSTAWRKIAPGLAAWHTGPNPKDVAVAVAWGDGKLRVWDAATGRVEWATDGKVNVGAAVSGPGKFLTTSSDANGDGMVREWHAGDDAARPVVRMPPEDPTVGPFLVPQDLAAFASQPGGAIDRAAVVARQQKKDASPDDRYYLLLFDLASGRRLGRCDLGPAQPYLRRVTVSPDGKHIAVGDGETAHVQLFSVANLTGGNPTPRDLHGDGASFQSVGFVKKKTGDPGLLLVDDSGAKTIFDFNGRRLVAPDDAWQPDVLEAVGWDVRTEDEKGITVAVVRGPGFDAKQVRVGEDCKVKVWAVLPPRPGLPFGPVLAVGYLNKNNQPRLILYDVQSGTPVRSLTGHTAVARSLSFSSDGRFLASAAGDQTVCVWSMVSLDQVLGKAGALSGVVVANVGPENNKHVEVAAAPDGSPLKVGDAIDGLVEGNKVRPLASAAEFYTAFFNLAPSSKAVLRVHPAGGAARDVSVDVGQGTDERNPMLCLFVTADGPPAKRDWIAWTMLGPYDASSPAAENYIGWHYNPDKLDQPVEFAPPEKNRKDNLSPGILKYLLEQGNATKARDAWRKDRKPEMVLRIDGVDPGGAPVHRRDLTLKAELLGYFPVEWVSSARWRLDGGPWQTWEKPDARTYSADLQALPWGRGVHFIQVQLWTDDDLRKLLDQQTAFIFLPERPSIQFTEQWLKDNGLEQSEETLTGQTQQTKFVLRFRAKTDAEAKAEKIQVALQGPDDKEPRKPTLIADGGDVEQEFTLHEGENVVKISAKNAGAGDDPAGQETREASIRLSYFRQRRAPAFKLSVRLPDGTELPAPSQQMVCVDDPKAAIVGEVKGDAEALQTLTRDGDALAGFVKNKDVLFHIEDKVDLKPGRQDVVYAAQTKNSAAESATVQLYYRPPAPKITAITQPLDPSEVDEAEVHVHAVLKQPADKKACTAHVLVNGVEQRPQILDADAAELDAQVQLRPGANQVVIQLSNAWGAVVETDPVHVRYVRPPRIVKFDAPPMSEQASVDLSADVESPADLQPTTAQLNKEPLPKGRFEATAQNAQKTLWKVTLRGVHLDRGKNAFDLVVGNEDALSRKSASAVVVYTKPPPPPPTVGVKVFMTPPPGEPLPKTPIAEVGGGDETPIKVLTPKVTLAFTVGAQAPLTHLEFFQEDGRRRPLRALPPNAGTEAKDAVEVQLQPGVTTFKLSADDKDGGHKEISFQLQLKQRPVYIVIDKLVSPDGKSEYTPLSDQKADGSAIFPEVKEGQVELYGRVIWSDPADERFRNPIAVRVYANGYQQIPVKTDPVKSDPAEKKATECVFHAKVLLTAKENNQIRVELPGKAAVANPETSQCVVQHCEKPVQGRRLHLLILGVGDVDDKTLQQQALEAIKAHKKDNGSYSAPPVFDQVEVRQPCIPQSRYIALNYLDAYKPKPPRLENADASQSDIVLIYYRGQEVVVDGEVALTTAGYGHGGSPSVTTISCRDIVERFTEDSPGAQVVMLDAEGAAAAKEMDVGADVGKKFKGTRMGLFNLLWAGGKQPTERLLDFVQKGWNQADNLNALADQVAGLSKHLGPAMEFFPELPDELKQLQFGGVLK
ncbi:MAG TPA: WD40 repeat domain-containing protein [Gemmataceae bacterium]|nr:WD40 repeat domain-containing protein [Gemmataceae bacterium]